MALLLPWDHIDQSVTETDSKKWEFLVFQNLSHNGTIQRCQNRIELSRLVSSIPFTLYWLLAHSCTVVYPSFFSVVTILDWKCLRGLPTFPSQSQHIEHTSSLRAFCSSVRRCGTYLAHTWCLLRSSVKIIYLVDCPKSSSCAM